MGSAYDIATNTDADTVLQVNKKLSYKCIRT